MFVRRFTSFIFALFALALMATAAHAAENYAPRPIAKSDRCPVCGMYPANFPQWHAQIVFKDGEHSSFDSAADMFRFLNSMAEYDKKHVATDVGGIFVPAHDNGAWLSAKQAFFVTHSNVKGPMGDDFPAFANEEDAMRFSRKSGGNILRFDQVTPAVIDGDGHHH